MLTGLEVTRNENGEFFLSQEMYIEIVLTQVRLEDRKPSNHLMDPDYEKNRVTFQISSANVTVTYKYQ